MRSRTTAAFLAALSLAGMSLGALPATASTANAPTGAAAADVCGGSLSDWSDPLSYSLYTSNQIDGYTVTVLLTAKGATTTGNVPYANSVEKAVRTDTYANAPALRWYGADVDGNSEGEVIDGLRAPVCAKGGTKVTSATFFSINRGGGTYSGTAERTL